MREQTFGVVLLNWNGADDTLASLAALRAAEPGPAHVIVVDNGSHDDSLARLGQWAAEQNLDSQRIAITGALPNISPSWLTIVELGTNRGFASGNNVGLALLAQRTSVSHFLLLNNDANVAQDYFARIAEALATVPDAGLMGCAIYYWPESNKVWYAGGYEIPYRALILHSYEVPDSPVPIATDFVTGCAMVISRELYEGMGGLSEAYTPIYWEDGEYSFRARKMGMPVMWAPAAKVYHRVGASVGGERITPQVAFWQNRHRGYYVRRNYSGATKFAALAYLVATKPARSFLELLRGRPRMASAIFRGFINGLSGRTA